MRTHLPNKVSLERPNFLLVLFCFALFWPPLKGRVTPKKVGTTQGSKVVGLQTYVYFCRLAVSFVFRYFLEGSSIECCEIKPK